MLMREAGEGHVSARNATPAARRVLLVEDEDPLRHIIGRNLTLRGYDVAEAADAAEAAEALRSTTRFGLIVLDVNLPDATGWDVLRHLPPEDRPAVIVVSALRPPQSRIAAFKPAAVLLKPFPIDVLLRLIERVCVSGRAAEEETGDEPEIAEQVTADGAE